MTQASRKVKDEDFARSLMNGRKVNPYLRAKKTPQQAVGFFNNEK